jgi:hypothetical protein
MSIKFKGTAFATYNNEEGVSFTADKNGVVTVTAPTFKTILDLLNNGLIMLGQVGGLDNLTATTDPTPSSDNTLDYSVGSKWVNTSNSNIWTCISSATGAAVWNLTSQGQANFRNLIDGGDFTTNPWQRGTTFTGITNAVAYTADRWFADAANSANSISVSQQAVTTVPGFGFALQFGRASANTDTHAIYLGQVLETLKCQALQGQQVTLSFWAKAGANFSAAASALTVALNHSTTAGNDTAAHLVAASTNWQSPATLIATTVTLTTSWQKFTLTGLACPAALTQLGLLFSYVTVGTAGANDWFQIAGVQLEQGGTATPFEHRAPQTELALCQHFYVRFNETVSASNILAQGFSGATNTQRAVFPTPVPMLSAPTVTLAAGTMKWNVVGVATALGTLTVQTALSNVNNLVVSDTVTTTAGQAVQLISGNSTGGGYVAGSADL